MRFPRSQTGPRTPIFWKRGFRGPKTPFPSALTRAGKGSFRSKIPISAVFLCRKKRDFGQKTPFSKTRGDGSFWTPKPSFPETGGSGPVWGQGIAKLEGKERGPQKTGPGSLVIPRILRNLCGSVLPEILKRQILQSWGKKPTSLQPLQ